MATKKPPALTPNKPLRDYRATHGHKRLKEVCETAGMSYPYLKHVMAGRRRLSIEKAKAFEKASGGELKAVALLGL